MKIAPAMINILGLMFLVFFIMAVLGTFLFKSITSGMVLDNDFVNFKTFGHSFLLMFRMSTGEDWHLIMYDCTQVSFYYSLYFIFYIIFVQYILVNLFVLIIMKEFDEYFYNDDNILTLY